MAERVPGHITPEGVVRTKDIKGLPYLPNMDSTLLNSELAEPYLAHSGSSNLALEESPLISALKKRLETSSGKGSQEFEDYLGMLKKEFGF